MNVSALMPSHRRRVANVSTSGRLPWAMRVKVELEQEQVTVQQLLAAAGFQGQDWDLLRLQGEGDPTGGTLITVNETVTVKPGDHFRVIPGNRTFGAASMAAPTELEQHVEEL